jgi:glycosyltransferase involved in cell wall biosynthesis
MDKPLVTIAIPTFNRAHSYLRGVIEAALAQTWEPLEILVGDNASTDQTPELIASFHDSRIRHLRHPENIGANGNFNRLLEEARGEWFLLLHDDDLVDPPFVETCLRTREPGVAYGFIRTGVRAIDSNGRVLKEHLNPIEGSRPEDLYRAWFRSQIGLFLCNTLYRTAALREVGGFRSLHQLLEDNYALVKIMGRYPYLDVPEVLASYRYTHDQRTFQVPVGEWCEDFRGLLKMIVAQVEPAQREDLERMGRRFFGFLCVNRANAIESPWRRTRARLTVARHFGYRSLRHRWSLPSFSD